MPKENYEKVFIGLGSNLGNREANLDKAVDLISGHLSIDFLKKSKWYENPAIDEAGPGDFLNGVIKISTSLEPLELLDFLQEVEDEIDPQRFDRGRKKARYLDLDILEYAQKTINDERLVLPHPRMKEREFVTRPMREIEASDYADEMIGEIDSNLAGKISELPSLMDAKSLSDYDLQKSIACADKIVAKISSQDKFDIRRSYLSDLDQIFVIDETIFGQKHWGRDTFTKELSNPNALYLVAVDKQDQEKILGYGGVWTILDEMHIMTLAVAEEHRGKKIAETILLAFIETALRNEISSITLEVRLSNLAAISLYEKYGFYRQGIRKNYYADGESALILWTENIHSDKLIQLFNSLLNKSRSL